MKQQSHAVEQVDRYIKLLEISTLDVEGDEHHSTAFILWQKSFRERVNFNSHQRRDYLTICKGLNDLRPEFGIRQLQERLPARASMQSVKL